MANLVMMAMAQFLRIAGAIFDYSLDWSLNFSKILAQVPVVDIGWKVLRDIANIVFIFIALWSGISITLGINAEKAWGLLAQMVLVALFINFSLFITKTVIDASNIAALHFYRLMVADPGGDTLPQHNVSEAFMNGLKLQTLYNSQAIGKDTNYGGSVLQTGQQKSQLNWWNITLISIFGSIFMLIAAFVFLAAAIMFVIRTVTLMMLMLLSPLAFVAWLLPGAQGLASEWWHKLWSQSFFAPLYMALAYVVVATIQSNAFSTYLRDASFAAALTSNGAAPGSMGIIFNFVIMSALLIGCLLVAQKLGATGSGMMMKVGGKLAGMGTGLVKAGTVGFAGSLGAKYLGGLGKTLKDRNTGATGVMGRAAFRFGDQLQKAKVLGGHSYKEQKEEGTFFSVGEKEIEERLKKMKSRPADQAQYLSNLSGDNRDHAYEHLSARDRVAVEQEGQRSGVLNSADIAALRTHLTAEERSKTENATRETAQEQQRRQQVTAVENVATAHPAGSPPPTPAQVITINNSMNALGSSQARNLSTEARTNAEIIRRLRPEHMNDLMRNGNLMRSEITAIMAAVNGLATAYHDYDATTGASATQLAQRAYVTSNPATQVMWTP